MFVTEQPVAPGGRLTFWLIVWAMIKQYCDVREVETGCLWALSVLLVAATMAVGRRLAYPRRTCR